MPFVRLRGKCVAPLSSPLICAFAWQVRRALELCDEHGFVKPAVYQVKPKGIEKKDTTAIELCDEHDFVKPADLPGEHRRNSWLWSSPFSESQLLSLSQKQQLARVQTVFEEPTSLTLATLGLTL